MEPKGRLPKVIDSWGSSVDREIWCSVIGEASHTVAHRLWAAVIREIAQISIERLTKPLENDLDSEGLAHEWLFESLPASHDLAWILGDLDYFRIRLHDNYSWEETVSFSGSPCGYSYDVAYDLRETLDSYPDTRDLVDEEMVDDFFQMWRTHLFRRVLKEVAELAMVAQSGEEAVDQKVSVPDSIDGWRQFALTLNGEKIARERGDADPGTFDVDLSEALEWLSDMDALQRCDLNNSGRVIEARMALYEKLRYLERKNSEPTTSEALEIEQMLAWLRKHKRSK